MYQAEKNPLSHTRTNATGDTRQVMNAVCQPFHAEREGGECGRLNDHLVALPSQVERRRRQTKEQKYFLICESIAHISLVSSGWGRKE